MYVCICTYVYRRLCSQIWVNISELVNWIVNTFSCHIIIIIILLNSLSYILTYLITYNSLCHSCFGLLTTTTYYHHMPTHTAQLRILLRHDRTIPQTINTNDGTTRLSHSISNLGRQSEKTTCLKKIFDNGWTIRTTYEPNFQ